MLDVTNRTEENASCLYITNKKEYKDVKKTVFQDVVSLCAIIPRQESSTDGACQ